MSRERLMIGAHQDDRNRGRQGIGAELSKEMEACSTIFTALEVKQDNIRPELADRLNYAVSTLEGHDIQSPNAQEETLIPQATGAVIC